MSRDTAAGTGDLIDLYDDGDLVCGVVVAEEKGRLKVVTESGKEVRITASRVAHRAGSSAGDRPKDAAATHARAAAARVREVDLTALWEVLAGEPQRFDLAGLSALALGEDSPVTRSAMLRALSGDRTYFTRKGDLYEARPRDQVEEILRRRVTEARRAERRAAFLDAAREALAAAAPVPRREGGGGLDADLVADLVELALSGEEAAARREAVALLDEARAPDGPPEERAFRLLRALGIFAEDENLAIHRFHLRTSFPPHVEAQARRAAASAPSAPGRADLRDLCAFTIDDEATTELDDALSVEAVAGPGALRMGVHIADPGSFIEIGDAVDQEAMARAATYYFPDGKLPMLPPCLGDDAASLMPGADRPALSFLVTLSLLGEILDVSITPSLIRSRGRMTYEAADAILAGGSIPGPLPGQAEAIAEALGRLRPLCEVLEADRIAAGAVVIRAPEVEVKVDPRGAISIRRIDERGPTRRLVSEAMILANRLAADFCVGRGLPAVYRRQAPPADAESVAASRPPDAASPELSYDPVAVRAQRRRMRRGEVGVSPGPHHGLGLARYTQATSPLRRFQDLLIHRQIRASLRGAEPPYDAEAVARIAAGTEEAERAARDAERGAQEYWILKHYDGLVGREVEAAVLAADPRRTEVELADTLYVASIAPRPGHAPGLRLRLLVEASRPRARRLTLREGPA